MSSVTSSAMKPRDRRVIVILLAAVLSTLLILELPIIMNSLNIWSTVAGLVGVRIVLLATVSWAIKTA